MMWEPISYLNMLISVIASLSVFTQNHKLPVLGCCLLGSSPRLRQTCGCFFSILGTVCSAYLEFYSEISYQSCHANSVA